VTVKLIDVNATADTDIVAEVMDCAALAVGSATLNMGIMPRLAATMTYLRGLKPAGKAGFAFGSYGWASKGAEEAAAYLGAMQVEILHEPITCRFRPDAATLARCREAGRLLAKRALTAGLGEVKR
jgi:flavorubredoxin